MTETIYTYTNTQYSRTRRSQLHFHIRPKDGPPEGRRLSFQIAGSTHGPQGIQRASLLPRRMYCLLRSGLVEGSQCAVTTAPMSQPCLY